MAIVQSIEDLTESFTLMDDWEDRYQLLIDMGRELPEFPESFKTKEYFVPGCVSQVWMVPKVEEGIFTFTSDSDGIITKGLLNLLGLIYNGQPVERIRQIDIKRIFTELGLENNLLPNRRNGFFAMVGRIQAYGL